MRCHIAEVRLWVLCCVVVSRVSCRCHLEKGFGFPYVGAGLSSGGVLAKSYGVAAAQVRVSS